jgi:opacity protein-like surface antigen
MTPHRRLILSLCFVVALAPAAAGAASSTHQMTAGSTNPALGAPVGAADYSFLLSLEIPPSAYSIGPRFTGEMMYGYMDLSPQLRLSVGGRLAIGIHGGDHASTWLFDAVPDAKLKYSVMPALAVYGDLGVGLAFLHTSVDIPASAGFPGASASDDSLALTFQFGGGVSYAVSPTVNLLGEIRFNFYTKSGAATFVSIPTIGLQFHP